MDISTAFSARAQTIEYNPVTLLQSDRIEARRVYDEQHAELNREFAEALTSEYLDAIAESRRGPIAASTFRMAWEEGHSSGYGEVENRYMDLADFAVQVYRAATS